MIERDDSHEVIRSRKNFNQLQIINILYKLSLD